MAKIYVSSTFKDLKEYRAKAIEIINGRPDHKAIAMEYYAAKAQIPLEKCLVDVKKCDVYVGIFAWRYGYIPTEDNPEGKSITELEYRHAKDKGIPCLIFLLDPDADWKPNKMDSFTRKGKRGKLIKDLRNDLSIDNVVSYFEKPDDLATAVMMAIQQWEDEKEDQMDISGESSQSRDRLFDEDEVREAAYEFKANFEAASNQITKLSQYKKIHDLFQEMESYYYIIEHDRKRLDTDESAWDNIAGYHEPVLHSKIKELINQAHDAQKTQSISKNAWWINDLGLAQTEIRNAIEKTINSESKDLLASGMRKLRRVLDLEVSKMNTLLLATAKVLDLKTIVEAMNKIQESLSESNQDSKATQEFEFVANSLQKLHPKFVTLVNEHDQWQGIDDELRRVEANLEAELKDEWPYIMSKADLLLHERQEDWAKKMRTADQNLKNSLDSQTFAKAKIYFRRFRSESGRRFRQVDHDLLKLTYKLQLDGKSLNSLLRSLQ